MYALVAFDKNDKMIGACIRYNMDQQRLDKWDGSMQKQEAIVLKFETQKEYMEWWNG